ncbi:MAG: CHAP domain-containing protein [Armatimonadetes bacterium]|nr:CHAP domain-containing protein [Armatimonadota bacterium]
MNEIVKTTLAVAASQVGVKELGTNAGPQVTAYLKSTGLPAGNPWCMAFVNWCEEQAAKQLGRKSIIPNTASCDVFHNWAKKNNLLKSAPQQGDCFLIYKVLTPQSFDATHVGFVLDVVKDEAGTIVRVKTIEGNTNSGGSREGDGVYRRSRPLGPKIRFVRWALMAKKEA